MHDVGCHVIHSSSHNQADDEHEYVAGRVPAVVSDDDRSAVGGGQVIERTFSHGAHEWQVVASGRTRIETSRVHVMFTCAASGDALTGTVDPIGLEHLSEEQLSEALRTALDRRMSRRGQQNDLSHKTA